MKKERVIIGLIFAAVVITLYYYLRNPNAQPQQIVYPNTQASGVPASQNPASTFNIAAPQAAPSPAAIYAPPLALPPAPNYQSYNYAPLNIYGLTPQAAATAPLGSEKKCGSGCCSSCSSCPTCPTGGTYTDGNANQCLASNPSQPATNPASIKPIAFMASNLDSFFGGQPS